MIKSSSIQAIIIVTLFMARAIAAPNPGLVGEAVDQSEDYPGYCSKSWNGMVNCHSDAEKPWDGLRLLPSAVVILSPMSSNAIGLDERLVCGGVLIAPDWVLTAGHCIPNNRAARSYKIGIGFADRRTGDELADGAEMPIRKIVRHPNWRSGANLALVQFREDPTVHIANPLYSPFYDFDTGTTSQLVFPKPPGTVVPRRGDGDLRFSDVSTGGKPPSFTANSIMFRWSRFSDGKLRLTKTPMFELPPSMCEPSEAGDRAAKGEMFCALSRERALCPSDSGAPLIGGADGPRYNSSVLGAEEMPRDLLLAAIATWDRDSCAEPGEPGQFIMIIKYKDWIRETVKQSYEKRKRESLRRMDSSTWGSSSPRRRN